MSSLPPTLHPDVPDTGRLRALASPEVLALAAFALLFLAAVVLWASFGTAIFLDGLAMAWSCF